MGKSEIGIRLVIEGKKEFAAAIANARKELQNLKKDLSKVEKGVDGSTSAFLRDIDSLMSYVNEAGEEIGRMINSYNECGKIAPVAIFECVCVMRKPDLEEMRADIDKQIEDGLVLLDGKCRYAAIKLLER